MEALREYGAAVFAALVAVIAFFMRGDRSRYEEGLTRIGTLERTYVSQAHLEAALERLRAERAVMHAENRAYLERIERQIGENEERSSRTRHDTNDTVQSLVAKVAVVAAILDERLPPKTRT